MASDRLFPRRATILWGAQELHSCRYLANGDFSCSSSTAHRAHMCQALDITELSDPATILPTSTFLLPPLPSTQTALPLLLKLSL